MTDYEKLKEMEDQMSRACEQADSEIRINNQLRVAYQKVLSLKKEVQAWMTAEGRQGHLRHNGQAPMWPAYEEALTAWEEAKKSLESSDESEQI